MTRVILAIAALAGAAHAGDGIVLGEGKSAFQLRFSLTVEGKPMEVAWSEFLDKTFDYFDRDGDGSLSRAEASRMFAFPLPGRRELTVNFDRLDANRDGKGSREELKAFCQVGGFAPVVMVVEPPTAADLRLAQVLTRHLDRDGDGKVSEAELRRATTLLDRFDTNEDEVLDRAELLALGGPSPRIVPGRLKAAALPNPDATIAVNFDPKGLTAKLNGPSEKRCRLTTATPARSWRLDEVAGDWTLTFSPVRAAPAMKEANDFLLAQFEGALEGRPGLAMADIEADATLAGLSDLFPFADRDGDGLLRMSELKTYLELIGLGTVAQTWVMASERGRSLFHLLDADGDGRLSYAELARAGSRREATGVVPWQAAITFGGSQATTWGGVPLPAPRRLRRAAVPIPKVPSWFRAMDRNGDGVLSPKEFIGPPERFRRLDADNDGVITPEEATLLLSS